MTETCSKCGANIPAGAKFCPECGKPIKEMLAKKCSKCGAENPPTAKFCKECGAQLPRRAVEVKPSGLAAPKQYLFIFGIGAAALIAVLIYYYIEFIQPVESKLNQTVMSSAPTQQSTDNTPPVQQQPPPSPEEVTAAVNDAKENPDVASSQIHAGNMLFDSGKFQEAIPYYKKALQLNPNNPDVLVDLGVCYYNTSDFKKAQEQFELALQAAPNHLNALYNLGIVALQTGQMEKVKDSWAKLNQIAPQSPQAQQAMKFLESIHKGVQQQGNQ